MKTLKKLKANIEAGHVAMFTMMVMLGCCLSAFGGLVYPDTFLGSVAKFAFNLH
jgi:hypothetical protein